MSTTQTVGRAARTPSMWSTLARGVLVALVLLFEIILLDGAYSFRRAVDGAPSEAWQLFNDTLQVLVYVVLYASVAFCFLAFAQHRSILSDWAAAARGHRWTRWFALQSVLFLAVMAALPAMQSGGAETPWAGFFVLATVVIAMVICAVLALAPLSFWRGFAATHAANAVVALLAGAFMYAVVEFSRNSWHDLAAITLHTSHWMLSLYEPGAVTDPANRILGAGGFLVTIDAPCSGYEGVGLVLGMLSFYIFAFRKDLRFPHVLALLPIGAFTIWILNAVRLTLLISIGAHVSPEVAIDGFHSQAGWIFFLAVTVSLMVLAHRASIFRANAAPHVKTQDPALFLAAALLAPFAALMASRIGGAIFGDNAPWVGVVLIVIPIATIWFYRAPIRKEIAKINYEPWLFGLIVGALWIVTEPVADADTLGPWLATQTPAGAAAWLALRVLGFALIVPIAEELVFRGYLHRALISRRFETVAPGAFTWIAFLATSLLFGAMHGRWLAGALAGAAFALTLYRSKTLAAPIAAHIAANGIIAVYAIAIERWELL